MTEEAKIKITPWIGLIAIVNVVIHMLFYNTLGFHRDELLYFSLGQHISAGYASVPPLIGLTAWFVIHTLGYSLLAARLIPFLLSGVMIFVIAAITREMKGKSYAQILAAIAFTVTPFNLRCFSLFMPVSFDIFFWSLTILLLLRWYNTKEDRFMVMLGTVVGLGLMNKYSIALEIFCLFVVLLFTPYRAALKRRAFYQAVIIGLLIFSPNIIWQVFYDLPVLTHMKALNDSQLVHVDRVAFFTDQFFLGSMGMLLIIPGIIFLSGSKIMRPYRPFLIVSFLVVIILALLRGKSYYTFGLYPFWIAAGGVYWEKALKTKLPEVIVPVLLVVLSIPIIPMGIPVFKSTMLVKYFAWTKEKLGTKMVLRWEDGAYHPLPQDYADMLGWDELAIITAHTYEQVPDKQSTLIYAENYGQAGAVMVLGKKYGLPDPACFSESFLYWIPRNPLSEITSLIYINDKLGSDVKSIFADCREIGCVSNPLAREFKTGVWLCTAPRSSFNDLWKIRIRQVNNPFYH
ncbi:MAG: glycosyltransferase family 39 protein [Bacteroidota bacterium]|nr:glycosyltransferase family 39 protein [Bacteroidota bacterium]